MLALLGIGAPSRDYPNHVAARPNTMTDYQRPKPAAQSQENKSLFLLRMVGVGDQKRVLVEEYRLRLFKRNTVLAPVLRVLPVVPLKAKLCHTEVV